MSCETRMIVLSPFILLRNVLSTLNSPSILNHLNWTVWTNRNVWSAHQIFIRLRLSKLQIHWKKIYILHHWKLESLAYSLDGSHVPQNQYFCIVAIMKFMEITTEPIQNALIIYSMSLLIYRYIQTYCIVYKSRSSHKTEEIFSLNKIHI